jgi:hypothetical protein
VEERPKQQLVKPVEVDDSVFLREDRNEVEFLFLKQLFYLLNLLIIFGNDAGPTYPNSSQRCIFLLQMEQCIEQDAL